jgi:hypothetical protein
MDEIKTEFNNIKNFDDLPVSTNTFIVVTNITIDLDLLFDFLPVYEYIVVPKKRGRKKKNIIMDPNNNIPQGSIITLDLKNKIKGVVLKKKKKKDGKNIEYFRNSLTVVMILDGKKINFKISRNGKFQMTGCKYEKHCEDCVKYIWEYIKDNKNIYELSSKHFKAIFVPAMRNIDFSLGFIVDREKLNYYFNNETNYPSLLDTSIGYTGVNIKIPLVKKIEDLKLKQLKYKKNNWVEPKYVPFQKYLDYLKPKEQQKKLKKERLNTFLVFQSGNVIMSSICKELSRDVYYEFIKIIHNNIELFKEKLNN